LIANIPSWINWTNGISLLGFVPLIIDVIRKIRLNKKNDYQLSVKEIFDFEFVKSLIIGALIFLFAILQNNNDNAEKSEASLKNDTLKIKIDSIISGNHLFYKYLKDTFGIEKNGDTAIITNQTIYNNKTFISQAPPSPNVSENEIPDSINYSVKISGDSLYFSPKKGIWSKAFVGFNMNDWDSIKEFNIISEGVSPGNDFATSVIKNKKYSIGIYSIYERSVNPKMPIKLDMKSYKYQFLIFGDQESESKRYLFQDGKVKWFPGY